MDATDPVIVKDFVSEDGIGECINIKGSKKSYEGVQCLSYSAIDDNSKLVYKSHKGSMKPIKPIKKYSDLIEGLQSKYPTLNVYLVKKGRVEQLARCQWSKGDP